MFNPIHSLAKGFAYACLFISICDVSKAQTSVEPSDSSFVYAKELGEIVVTAKPIRHTASGYVAMIDQSKTNGRTFSQVMSMLPFVNVDENSLSVLSREVGIFYIDGMKVGSFEEIKMLPSESIRSVQVEYAAGAGEEGSAGPVVRITLRQPVERGYYGQVWANGNALPAYDYAGETVGGYFTTQQGPVRITALGQYRHQKLIGRTSNEYIFDSGSKLCTKDQYDGWQKMPYGNLVTWWQINSRNTLGLSLTAMKIGLKSTSVSHNKDMSKDAFSADNDSHQYSGLLSWKGMLSPSIVIDASVNYISHHKTNENDYEHIMSDISSTDGYSRGRTGLFKAKASLKWLKGSSTWILGGDLQRVNSRDYDTHTFYGDVPDLKMEGWRPGAFASYSYSAGRISLAAGLRLQSNRQTVWQADTRHFLSKTALCPDLSFTYMIVPEQGTLLNLNYSRTLDEMPYSVISLYPNFLSPQSYTVGNPNITVPTTDLVTATFSYKGIVSLYTLYQRTSHPIYFSTSQDEDGANLLCSMANNGKYEWISSTGVEVTLSFWSKVKPKLSAAYKMMRSKNADFTTPKKGSWTFGINTELNISRTFGGNLSANYETSSRVYDMWWGQVWGIDLSLYKFLFNGKLRLSLDCKPYQKGRKVVTYGTNVEQISRNVTRQTSIAITARVYVGSYNNIKGEDRVDDIQQYHQYENHKDMK